MTISGFFTHYSISIKPSISDRWHHMSVGDAAADPASKLGPGHFHLGWAGVSCLEWTVHLLVFRAYLRLIPLSSLLILQQNTKIYFWGSYLPVLDFWPGFQSHRFRFHRRQQLLIVGNHACATTEPTWTCAQSGWTICVMTYSHCKGPRPEPVQGN